MPYDPKFPFRFRAALNNAISSGRFADTKIILYSRRNATGTVYKPRALYANSEVLDYVGFFGYVAHMPRAESTQEDFSDHIDGDEEAEGYEYDSDSDLEDGDDEDVKYSVKKGLQKVHHMTHLLRSRHASHWSDKPCGKGRVIKIHDVAFITFQAFLMYLYTDQIEFAPYGLKEKRKSGGAGMEFSSPKSMYRLADKFEIPLLKALALKSIRSGLGRCDIVEEVCSKFSSKHAVVREIFIARLASDLRRPGAYTELWSKFKEKLKSFDGGDSGRTIMADVLNRSGDWVPEYEPPSPVNKPSVRKDVETALIKSIREGIFFDRKYWTRRSQTGSALRPVYISTIVLRRDLEKITDLVRTHVRGRPLESNAEYEDSDYESDSEQTNGSTQEAEEATTEGGESESLSILTKGTAASWKALFFYSCTGEIEFAPLKSLGKDERRQKVQMMGGADKPAACSPKVIHSLAEAMQYQNLCSLALESFRSGITAQNVVEELFFGTTVEQEGLKILACQLFIHHFNNEETREKGCEFVKGMAGGNSERSALAQKLVLKEGILKKCYLRCSLCCSRFPLGEPDCRKPGCGGYAECVNCGSRREEPESSTCGFCQKEFLPTQVFPTHL